MVIRSKSKFFAAFAIGMVTAVATAAVAQSAAPTLPSPTPAAQPVYQAEQAPAAAADAPAAPVVVAPVVPQSNAQLPGALEAIEQTAIVTTSTPSSPLVPVVSGPEGTLSSSTAGPAPYVVPPPGPGIFQGSEQTMREILYLQTEVAVNGKRKERIESVAALKAAEKELADQLAGKSTTDTKAGAPAATAGGPAALPGSAVVVVPPKPEPYVNSVYGYGGDMYAEIVLGSSKVLATKGTILNDGSRVIAVSNNGVTISSKGRTKKIAIRGAAGY